MAADGNIPIGTRPPVLSVAGALQKAAQNTGASFDYLLATAKAESGLDPTRSARMSSATGLFQFLEQTWLGVLKNTGNMLGLGRFADAITQNSAGRYVVNDPTLRSEIKSLRKDATVSAMLGGALAQQNAAMLRSRLGRAPKDGELYMAHFLGPAGAAKLISRAGSNPHANAATMFPRAAKANRSIFYDRQGHARSVAGVYGELMRRYEAARASALAGLAPPVTGAPNKPPLAASAPPASAGTAGSQVLAFAGTGPAAGTAAMKTTAASAPQSNPTTSPQTTAPVFHSLFQSNDGRPPVAALVAQLWSAETDQKDALVPGPPGLPVPTIEPARPANISMHDLFRDARPNVSTLFDGSA